MGILEINVQYLRNNINLIKKYVGGVKFCFPVKANAYGHGLDLVVKNTYDLVDLFAVANTLEAFRVLDNTDKPVLIFGAIDYNYIDKILYHNIRVSIQSYGDIEKLESFAKQYNKKVLVHIKVNTGFNRMGVDYDDACNTIKRAYESNWIILEGVYSHLACADDKDNPMNIQQKNKFDSIVKFTKELSPDITCHLSNSYGFLGQKDICYDMVRPGILTYGFLPEFKVDEKMHNIRPIARLLSKVVKIITLKEGDRVGYSMTYKAYEKEQIAIVPIGYGDGFPRKLGGRGFVNINGNIYPIVGRVSMDMLSVSLGFNENNVEVGNVVELISDIPSRENSAFSIAKKTNTIVNDTMTTLNERILRKVV